MPAAKAGLDLESHELQVRGSKMNLEDREIGPDTKLYCVVDTAPAEKQW